MKYVTGNLLKLAMEGKFDIIAHGCNCFQAQKSGIAADMSKYFNTDLYEMESDYFDPTQRLGNVDNGYHSDIKGNLFQIFNWYTQYLPGRNFHENAFRLCCQKMVLLHDSDSVPRKIGLPKIGAGIAGGDWNVIEQIILEELDPHFDVTIVEFDGSTYDVSKERQKAIMGQVKFKDNVNESDDDLHPSMDAAQDYTR